MESILLGKAEGDKRKYLLIGGVLFVAIAVLSFGETASWPLRTGFETVDIGTISIQLSTLSSIFHLGYIALGILMAFMSARRKNGLLISLLLGSVPIIGYGVGVGIYYGVFWDIGYLTIPPSYLLAGAIFGMIGFILGRTW